MFGVLPTAHYNGFVCSVVKRTREQQALLPAAKKAKTGKFSAEQHTILQQLHDSLQPGQFATEAQRAAAATAAGLGIQQVRSWLNIRKSRGKATVEAAAAATAATAAQLALVSSCINRFLQAGSICTSQVHAGAWHPPRVVPAPMWHTPLVVPAGCSGVKIHMPHNCVKSMVQLTSAASGLANYLVWHLVEAAGIVVPEGVMVAPPSIKKLTTAAKAVKWKQCKKKEVDFSGDEMSDCD